VAEKQVGLGWCWCWRHAPTEICRQAKVKKESFDWNCYNDDSQYHAHKKRIASMPKVASEISARGDVDDLVGERADGADVALAPGEALDPMTTGVISGTAPPVREAALNRLVDGLHAQVSVRTQHVP
jgi:hypothetical protein